MFSFKAIVEGGKTIISHECDGVTTRIDAPDIPPQDQVQAHFDYCIDKLRAAGLVSGEIRLSAAGE